MRSTHYNLLAAMIVSLLVCTCAGRASDPNNLMDTNDLQIDSPFVKDGKLDIEAAVKYFEDLYRSKSSISQVRMNISKPRAERTMTMKIWTLGQEKALILIQSPAREKGTATLKVDNNLWNYLPRIKRTIRIPPSMMLASWMGSDFTNDDLVRDASYSKDYTYELVGRSSEPEGWRVHFTAKPDMVGLWNRINLVLSNDGTIPLQADYYDRKDRLSRRIVWSEIRQFGDKRIPATMTLTPEDKQGYRTIMTYTAIDFDVDVPESFFNLSQLENLQ